MASGQLKLTLRQKPHLDWISQGYAGLLTEPASGQARIEGTVEVRIQQAGSSVHVKVVKVELKKTETVLTSKGVRRYFELIGAKEQVAWEGAGKPGVDREGFAPLESSDHAFSIPVPAGLPPTISLEKGKSTGIVYHIVVSALIKPRAKTLFGGTSSSNFKAPTTITQLAEVQIEKHELNPTWPIYRFQADMENLHTSQGKLSMRLRRECVCIGAGDPTTFNVDLRSERAAPVKITRLELTLRETIITREVASGGPAAPAGSDPRKAISQSTDVFSTKTSANSLLYSNETTSHTFTATIPASHQRFTVQNAKHLEVKYSLRLRAVVEVPKEAKSKKGNNSAPKDEEPVKELVIDNIPVLVSPWGKKSGDWWRQKIGQTPRNLDRPSDLPAAAVPSLHGQPPAINSAASQMQQPQQSSPQEQQQPFSLPQQQYRSTPVPSAPQNLQRDQSAVSPIQRPSEWAALPIPGPPPSAEQQAQLDRERAAARERARPMSMAVPPSASMSPLGASPPPQAGARPRRSSLDMPKPYVPQTLVLPTPLSQTTSNTSTASQRQGGSPVISAPMDARKEQPSLPTPLNGPQAQQQQQQQQQSTSQAQPQPQPQQQQAFVPASAPPVPVHLDNRRLSTLQRTNPRSIPYSSTARPAQASAEDLALKKSISHTGIAGPSTANTSTEALPGTNNGSRRSSFGGPGGPGTIPAAVFTGRHLSSFRPYSPQFMLLKQQQEEALRQQQQQQGQASPNVKGPQVHALASQSTSALPQSQTMSAFPSAGEQNRIYAPQAQSVSRPQVLRHRTASQSEPDLPSLGRTLSQPSSPAVSANPITSIGPARSPSVAVPASHRYSRSDSGHGISPSSSYGSVNPPYRANTSRAGVMSWHGQAAQMQSFRAPGGSSPPLKMDGAYPAIPSRSPGASKRDSLGNIDLTRSLGPTASPRLYPQSEGRRSASDSTTAPLSPAASPAIQMQPAQTASRDESAGAVSTAQESSSRSASRSQFAVSAVPIAPSPRRRNTRSPPASPTNASPAATPGPQADTRESSASSGYNGISSNGYPMRKNTLSTIAASPISSAPETPLQLSRSLSNGSGSIAQSEWPTAEQEKERLYTEAKERARATQEAAGHSVPGPVPERRSSASPSASPSTEEPVYKSVEGRAGTPLSLMRTMSNPEPVRRNSRDLLSIDQALRPTPSPSPRPDGRTSGTPEAANHAPRGTAESFDGHGFGNNRDNEAPHPMRATMSDIGHGTSYGQPPWQSQARTSTYGALSGFGPPPVPEAQRPHARLASDSSFASASSRSTIMDEQKLAYLKALAAREAYQQRRAGGEAAPLTALEEKERLRQLYAEEEERAGNTSTASQHTHMGQASLNRSHAAPFAPSTAALYSPGSVYLTPGTSAPRGPNASVEYFDQPALNGNGGRSSGEASHSASNTSSSSHQGHAASEQSHASASVVSPSWHRNPAIAKGKQRRYSSYIENDSDEERLSAQAGPPPARPPKPREVVADEYSYLDTPVSPGAAEYQRQFFFRHSMSASSHTGH